MYFSGTRTRILVIKFYLRARLGCILHEAAAADVIIGPTRVFRLTELPKVLLSKVLVRKLLGKTSLLQRCGCKALLLVFVLKINRNNLLYS